MAKAIIEIEDSMLNGQESCKVTLSYDPPFNGDPTQITEARFMGLLLMALSRARIEGGIDGMRRAIDELEFAQKQGEASAKVVSSAKVDNGGN